MEQLTFSHKTLCGLLHLAERISTICSSNQTSQCKFSLAEYLTIKKDKLEILGQESWWEKSDNFYVLLIFPQRFLF